MCSERSVNLTKIKNRRQVNPSRTPQHLKFEFFVGNCCVLSCHRITKESISTLQSPIYSARITIQNKFSDLCYVSVDVATPQIFVYFFNPNVRQLTLKFVVCVNTVQQKGTLNT